MDKNLADFAGMFSTGRVHIYVTDENDHQPMLRVKGDDMIEISEHAQVGSVIALIEGIDDDLGKLSNHLTIAFRSTSCCYVRLVKYFGERT